MSAGRVALYVILTSLALAVPISAWGAAGTDSVARPGQQISPETIADYDWPQGVLELANDPLRGEGWHPWFSEWPNDVLYFALHVRDRGDVQHLIDQMKKVKTLRRQIVLHPGREAEIVAFTRLVKEGNDIGAVLQVGSQKRIDQWYGHLREIRPGVKGFGVIEYEKAPEARPPTLDLYVQHPAIDLEKLEIPTTIHVSAEIPPSFRKDEGNRDLIQRLEQFVAQHQARQAAANAKKPRK